MLMKMLHLLKQLLERSGLKTHLDGYIDGRIRRTALAKVDELTLNTWDSLARADIAYAVKNDADGYKILCPTRSVLGRLIFAGNFEVHERDFVKHFLRPGDTFVDIGANIGLFTLLGARIVGQNGLVLAFEPNPETFARLEDNIRINRFSNVNGFNIGLSDHAGALDLVTSLDGYDAWDSFGQPSAPGKFASRRVEVDTVDALFSRRSILAAGVELIKIDAEGWEPFILEGGRNFFAYPSAPTLLVEFTDRNLISAKRSARELYEILERLGYQLFNYNPDERRLTPEAFRGDYPYVNLVATKHREKVDSRLRENLE